ALERRPVDALGAPQVPAEQVLEAIVVPGVRERFPAPVVERAVAVGAALAVELAGAARVGHEALRQAFFGPPVVVEAAAARVVGATAGGGRRDQDGARGRL